MGIGFLREVLSFGHAAPLGKPGTGPAVTACSPGMTPLTTGNS